MMINTIPFIFIASYDQEMHLLDITCNRIIGLLAHNNAYR